MNKVSLKNNMAVLVGEIASSFEFSNKCAGEKFYKTLLKIARKSGNFDIIPVIVSDRLIDSKANYTGRSVSVKGQFRSRSKLNKLELFVFAEEFSLNDSRLSANVIWLEGNLCKNANYRTTISQREVADVIIATNRMYNKSDYIPCIVWGRNARYISSLGVGSRVQIKGRIQSREYTKKLKNGMEEKRTAYEVSVNRIDVVESEESEDGSRSEENL